MSFNSPGKKKIRQDWNTPLIRKLSDSHLIKYHYFGFPGIEAHDITLWKQYIQSVTAFEAPDDIKSGSGEKNLAILEKKLVELGFEPQCYLGFLESIIQTRVDNRGRKFAPKQFYTLLNLDFCSHLTSRTLVDQAKVTARYETLSRIAGMQKDLWDRHGISGSIWLITLREEISLSEYQTWRTNLDDRTLADWVDTFNSNDVFNSNKTLVTNPYKLKAFLYKIVKSALDGVRFSSYWYPIVLYTGNTARSKMAHFMILCQANDISNSVVVPLQKIEDFLTDDIIQISNDKFYKYHTDSVIENCVSFVECVCKGINLPFIAPLQARSTVARRYMA